MRRYLSGSRAGSFRLFGVVLLIVVSLCAGIAVARSRNDDSSGRLARSGHTATLLADGRVLVVGGERESGAIARSEVFDPATGESRNGAVAAYPRADHTATLLRDGRVLVAGGRNGSTPPLDAVEAWDPETNSFSIVGHLTVPRTGHVAVALRDGRVLIAGGDAGGTMEMFDGSCFQAIGARLTVPRFGASAALLRDGRILVAGGRDAKGAALGSADVVDLTSFSVRTFDMKAARVAPMLSMLPDGKVQVIGGDGASTMEMFDGRHFTALTVLRVLDAKTIAGSMTRFAFDRTDATRIDAALATAPTPAKASGGRAVTNSKVRAVVSPRPPGAWVSTDLVDYAPGQTVIVTGGGFTPGETVTLLFQRNPETTPATTLTAVADANGEFTNSDYVCLPTDVNVTFTLTAAGRTSGAVAITSFTDASVTVTVGAHPETLTYGTAASATFLVAIDRTAAGCGGAATYTVTTTSLASGVTQNALSILFVGGGDCVNSGTLTLNTSTSTPAASDVFTVGVDDGAGNSGSSTGTLSVGTRVLNVTATASNKVYNCFTTATGIVFSDDRVAGDTFTVGYTSATFSNQNVGVGKTVTISGLTKGAPGTGAGNYTFAADPIFTTANITQATPTVTVTGGTGTFTYNNTQRAITATATGCDGDLLSGGTPFGFISYTYTGTLADTTSYGPTSTAPTNAGTYTAYATYTDNAGQASDNYVSPTNSSAPPGASSITINKATPSARLFSAVTGAQSDIYYNYFDATAHTVAEGNVGGIGAGTTRVTGVGGSGDVLAFGVGAEVTNYYRGASNDACVGVGGTNLSAWQTTAYPAVPAGQAGDYIVAVDYTPTPGTMNANNYLPLVHTTACTTIGCGGGTNAKAGDFIIAKAPNTIIGPFTTNAPYDGLTQLGVPDVTVVARHIYNAPHALGGTKTGRTLSWETYNSDNSVINPSDYCQVVSSTAADANGDSTAVIRIDHATPSTSSKCTVRAFYSHCDFVSPTAVTRDVFINPALPLIEWATPNATDTATALTQTVGTLGAPNSAAPHLDAVAYWVNSQTGSPVNTIVDTVGNGGYQQHKVNGVQGVYSYTYGYYPPAGTFLPAGQNQTLALSFSTTNPDFISPRAANQYIDVNAAAAPVSYCDTYHYGVTPQRSFTVTTLSGSNVVTSDGLGANVFKNTDVGAFIQGTGIPANSSIIAFASTSSVTISANATATGSTTATLTTTTPVLQVLPGRTFTVVTTSGSKTVTSAGPPSAGFLGSYVGTTITGTGIPAGATIFSFTSPSEILLSVPATVTGSTTATLSKATNDGPMRGMVSGDFNGDGRIDLLVASNTSLAFYGGRDDGTFNPPVEVDNIGGSGLYALVSGDFDGDSDVDIAVTDAFQSKIYIYKNNGLAVFVRTQTLTAADGLSTPYGMVAAKVSGGANVDLVVTNYTSSTVEIFTNDGSGTFALAGASGLNTSTYTLNANDKPWGVVTGQFTGGAEVDVMVALNGTTNSVAILQGDGTGRFVSLSKILKNVGGPNPRTLAAADLDGNLLTDVLVGNYGNPSLTPTGSIFKMLQAPAGSFTTSLVASIVRPSSIVIGDIAKNLDSIPDFAVVSYSANTLYMYKGASTGAGNYTVTAFGNNTRGVKTTGTSPYTVVLGDFDRTTSGNDGKLELAVDGATVLREYSPDVVATATLSNTFLLNGVTKNSGDSTGGQKATLTVTLAGTGPYVVKWSDGTTQNTTAATLTRIVQPAATTTYTLASVTGGSACGGTPSGSVTLTVP